MSDYPITRTWAMPNHDTFSIKPINQFVRKYLEQSNVSIDPFARDTMFATYRNDLNPNTKAEYHLDAIDFVKLLQTKNVCADLMIFDAPYTPRQVSECYKSVGKEVTMKDTQSSFWSNIRKSALNILSEDAVVLTFGYSTVGMGKKMGFEICEILLVCHGGHHNDTICMAERRVKEYVPKKKSKWKQPKLFALT